MFTATEVALIGLSNVHSLRQAIFRLEFRAIAGRRKRQIWRRKKTAQTDTDPNRFDCHTESFLLHAT